ncbi:DUF4864 domain-containing protein [Lutimaribacter sp. EGI FJ00015]|uniref:DUF4864 domain-containing protein n=1 Tax=Lutimaribacter degradans TaxID=2945989 RepID=A0ACC5ZV53_9RHOB|nr:DUF4864 domain-containing protein [Lutimaribacter sp. EGI FJ00013]MCM2561725.1 DUF4864 domain-containing protein [Lutimaribacter sp. EGI FJ00013]MCO0612562.1 DUF4864 domain-containing protein [Lutimaribacter sp. EGI FJ00015]MCO0635221.1 DUF4864 domain-containing protein [Lutimaribacter sp. EGI FJ00014]
MRRFFLIFALLLGLALPGHAQQQAITDVIDEQLQAFKADDFDRAFTFASPTIKDIFRTPENFGAMVRRGYPMVWRPAEVRYLQLRDEAGSLWQRVQITDAQGRVHLLDYQMIETENGWQINGVQLLKAPGTAA